MQSLEAEKSENPPGENERSSHHVLHKADRNTNPNESKSLETKHVEEELHSDDPFADTTKKDLTEIHLYLDLVVRIITIINRLNLTPIQWNKKRKRIQITDNRLNYLIWFSAVYILTMVAIYATWRLLKELFYPTSTFEGYKLILYGMYYLLVLMFLVYDYTLIFMPRESVQLLNTYIASEFAMADILIAKRHRFKEENLMEFKKFRRLLLSMYFAGLTAGSVIPLSAVFSNSDVDPLRRFVMEHFPPEFVESPWIIGFFVLWMYNILFHAIIGICYVGALATMVFTVRFNHYLKFVLLEDKQELLLHDPLAAIKMHTYMQYSMKIINIWGEYLMPPLQLIGNVIHTFSMYGSLMLYNVVPMPAYFFFPIFSVNVAVFARVIFLMAASLYEGSVEAKNVWSSKPCKKWVAKKIRTMFPFGFRAGMFFMLKRETATTFFSTAVNNTIDLSLAITIKK